MALFGLGFRVSCVDPADDWRMAQSKITQKTMDFQNSLRSRFVPLVPRATRVIPLAPQDPEITIDPKVQSVLKRLIAFEASLLQWVTASPTHGHIFFEDPLVALTRARVAVPASRLAQVHDASA
jgi:hypothetical protein